MKTFKLPPRLFSSYLILPVFICLLLGVALDISITYTVFKYDPQRFYDFEATRELANAVEAGHNFFTHYQVLGAMSQVLIFLCFSWGLVLFYMNVTKSKKKVKYPRAIYRMLNWTLLIWCAFFLFRSLKHLEGGFSWIF